MRSETVFVIKYGATLHIYFDKEIIRYFQEVEPFLVSMGE